MLDADVPDEFHDDHGLAHACSPEKGDLAAAGKGRQQVNGFDARFHYLRKGLQPGIGYRGLMNSGDPYF